MIRGITQKTSTQRISEILSDKLVMTMSDVL